MTKRDRSSYVQMLKRGAGCCCLHPCFSKLTSLGKSIADQFIFRHIIPSLLLFIPCFDLDTANSKLLVQTTKPVVMTSGFQNCHFREESSSFLGNDTSQSKSSYVNTEASPCPIPSVYASFIRSSATITQSAINHPFTPMIYDILFSTSHLLLAPIRCPIMVCFNSFLLSLPMS